MKTPALSGHPGSQSLAVGLSAVSPSKTREDAAAIPDAPPHGLTVTKINRYKCIHCGKHGYSAGRMRKHAKRCTNNPDRKCAMHYQEFLFDRKGYGFDGYEVKECVRAAMALLPDPEQYGEGPDEFGYVAHPGLEEAVIAVMPEVSAAVGGCPACTLAALRQKGIPFMLKAFDFKKAAEQWKDSANYEYGHKWR